MYLRIGPYTRPLNEAVAAITVSPIYDLSRRVVKLRERWDITGRIVLDTIATQQQMTAEIQKLSRDFSQQEMDLVFLEDETRRETALALKASQCLIGPYIVDSSLPNQANDVYSNGQGYRVVYEAERPASGSGSSLMAFTEQISQEPGGAEFVYVGGSVNWPERQLGSQHTTWRYTQSGSALGLYAAPAPPPPIWPWALIKPEAASITVKSPRVLGQVDTEFETTWAYEYEWHLPLYGRPHRRT